MSRATELADDITPTAEHVPGLREMLDAAAELRRIDRVNAELVEALRDMNAGWKYIRSMHGDLYGVGWDRAQNKADAALTSAQETPNEHQ